MTWFLWLWVSRSLAQLNLCRCLLLWHTSKERKGDSFCWFDHKIYRWEFSTDPGVEGEPGKHFFFVIFFRFSWFNMNSSRLSVDRQWSHAHPTGENPRPVKPKICFVHRDEFSHAEVGLVTLKRFMDEDIYWRLLGILTEFPPKKILSWILDKRERERGWCSVALLLTFYFLFTTVMRKRADCKCTTEEVGDNMF